MTYRPGCSCAVHLSRVDDTRAYCSACGQEYETLPVEPESTCLDCGAPHPHHCPRSEPEQPETDR